jgi:hypothetical protein
MLLMVSGTARDQQAAFEKKKPAENIIGADQSKEWTLKYRSILLHEAT